MARVLERLSGPPRLMKYAQAARMLGISPSKLKTLVRKGVIVPTKLGETKMISLKEIERVSTPRLTPKAEKHAATPSARYDAKAEAEAARAALKRAP